MCCTRLAGNTGRKNQNRHMHTMAQICRAISSQLRHVSTIGKKLLNVNISPTHLLQYGELRPTNGWDLFASLGHRSKFQRVSRLGSVTARHSSSGRQPNFAALNRGRHLYSAGRPSRWALAHILVAIFMTPHNTNAVKYQCYKRSLPKYEKNVFEDRKHYSNTYLMFEYLVAAVINTYPASESTTVMAQ